MTDYEAGFVEGFRRAVEWAQEWLAKGGDPREIVAKFGSVSDEVLVMHAAKGE